MMAFVKFDPMPSWISREMRSRFPPGLTFAPFRFLFAENGLHGHRGDVGEHLEKSHVGGRVQPAGVFVHEKQTSRRPAGLTRGTSTPPDMFSGRETPPSSTPATN